MVLAILNEDKELCFKHFTFYLSDNKELLAIFPVPYWKRLLSKNRLLTRLFRWEPSSYVRLNNNRYIFTLLHRVWLLDIYKKEILELFPSRKGFSNPLNFCSQEKEGYVFWGDYGNNPEREIVNIYKLRAMDLETKIVYQFPKGSIRHVHNIIWNEDCKKYYILTGDLESSSGIYVANEDWTVIAPIKTGKQQFRAVVGFPYKEGLVYATDSVEDENHIYLLHNEEITPICSFPGSCIYGTETKNHFIFSSTVEPSEGRGFLNLFSYKLGKGIKDYYVHILAVEKCNLSVKEISRVPKDWLPMKLFQYGSVSFPIGQKISSVLRCNIKACKEDGKTITIKL